MKKITLFFLIMLTLAASLSTLFLSSTGLAVTNTSTVYVNVSEAGQLSVTPTALSWALINPGDNGTDKTVTLTNTGSTTLSNLYASVNSFVTEASNPIGGASTAFAAGSYLVLKNTSDNDFRFVNRMEWNDSSITDSITGKNANGVSWGKYRNKTQFWVWEVRKDNNGECLNTTSGVPNTAAVVIQGAQGSWDLASGTSPAIGVANTTEWGVWTGAGPWEDYCIAVRKNCQSLMIYKWDWNSTITPTCTKRKYLNSTLAVGKSLTLTANVYIPSGTPGGNATASTLTFTAT